MKEPDDSRFPAAIYADTVLSINFRDAQLRFLNSLIEIHYAHTLMLARQGIISEAIARKCVRGLNALDRAELARCSLRWQNRGSFLPCGRGSRAFVRQVKRGIDAHGAKPQRYRRHSIPHLPAFRDTRYSPKPERRRSERWSPWRSSMVQLLMPAYTHTQPAQPITLTHYLLAVVELMGRDERRLQAAYATVNRCPMGACAISTTGFPIDREFTASLLGFEGLQLNSYGAIAATDYLTETAGAISTAMLNLGRVTQDFLLWCTAEFGYLRLSDAWVQISSIMPQKRNPVPFEHVRVARQQGSGASAGNLHVFAQYAVRRHQRR